jgi:hypothetical protein
MKVAVSHPMRTAVIFAGVVVATSLLVAVLRVGGSFAAQTPTITVTCEPNASYYGAARAVFTWSGNGIGYIEIQTGGVNNVQLRLPGKSGTFTVDAQAEGPTVYASAQVFSTPDKTGAVTQLASADTPTEGCTYG